MTQTGATIVAPEPERDLIVPLDAVGPELSDRAPAVVSPAPGVLTVPRRFGRSGRVVAAEPDRFAGARRDAIYRRSLATADIVAALGALVASSLSLPPMKIATLALAPLIVLADKFVGTYDREASLVGKSTLDETPKLFQLATLYALVAWLVNGLLVTGLHSRRQLLILWLVLFVLLLVLRPIARKLSSWRTAPERCLLIGDTAAADWLRAKFARPSLHAGIVAQIAPTELGRREGDGADTQWIEDVQEMAARLGVDRLVITSEVADGEGVIPLVHAATSGGLKVSVLPTVLDVVGSSIECDEVEGVPLLSMRPVGLRRSSRIAKRTIDLVGSFITLLIFLPLLALISVVIRLDSEGPALFRQRRVGRDGSEFEMLKFRTMVVNAEEQQGHLAHLNEANGLFKIAQDPRITRVGRLLRRTSCDELPQLFNVLRGEMSLVGPRPLVAQEDRRIEGWHRRRLRLTPGMTGHWQILGSARIPLDDMVRIDYLYVTNWSLWLDVKILLRTIPYMISRKGL